MEIGLVYESLYPQNHTFEVSRQILIDKYRKIFKIFMIVSFQVSYARQSSPETKNTNVYVASLPASVTEEKLFKLFSRFGAILTSKLLTNPDGNDLPYYMKLTSPI